MKTLGQLYAMGVWQVKEGHETEFIREWQRFASWTLEHVSGAIDAELLQDLENPRRFTSFGPWVDQECIDNWRSMLEFKEFFSRAQEICEDIKPYTMKLAAHPFAQLQEV